MTKHPLCEICFAAKTSSMRGGYARCGGKTATRPDRGHFVVHMNHSSNRLLAIPAESTDLNLERAAKGNVSEWSFFDHREVRSERLGGVRARARRPHDFGRGTATLID